MITVTKIAPGTVYHTAPAAQGEYRWIADSKTFTLVNGAGEMVTNKDCSPMTFDRKCIAQMAADSFNGQ